MQVSGTVAFSLYSADFRPLLLRSHAVENVRFGSEADISVTDVGLAQGETLRSRSAMSGVKADISRTILPSPFAAVSAIAGRHFGAAVGTMRSSAVALSC